MSCMTLLSIVKATPKIKPANKPKMWFFSMSAFLKFTTTTAARIKKIPKNFNPVTDSEKNKIPKNVEIIAEDEIKIAEKLIFLTLKLFKYKTIPKDAMNVPNNTCCQTEVLKIEKISSSSPKIKTNGMLKINWKPKVKTALALSLKPFFKFKSFC